MNTERFSLVLFDRGFNDLVRMHEYLASGGSKQTVYQLFNTQLYFPDGVIPGEEGFIETIKKAWEWVADKVKSIVNTILGFFGIKSPFGSDANKTSDTPVVTQDDVKVPLDDDTSPTIDNHPHDNTKIENGNRNTNPDASSTETELEVDAVDIESSKILTAQKQVLAVMVAVEETRKLAETYCNDLSPDVSLMDSILIRLTGTMSERMSKVRDMSLPMGTYKDTKFLSADSLRQIANCITDVGRIDERQLSKVTPVSQYIKDFDIIYFSSVVDELRRVESRFSALYSRLQKDSLTISDQFKIDTNNPNQLVKSTRMMVSFIKNLTKDLDLLGKIVVRLPGTGVTTTWKHHLKVFNTTKQACHVLRMQLERSGY